MLKDKQHCTCDTCFTSKTYEADEEVDYRYVTVTVNWATAKQTVSTASKQLHVCTDCYLGFIGLLTDNDHFNLQYVIRHYFEKLFKNKNRVKRR